MKGFLWRLTGFDPSRNSLKTEIIAGMTTFIAMSYILAVNPSILGESGMPKGAVFTATALTSALTTILMAVFGKNPFAQAPGMSINAYFTYTLVKQLGYTWQSALTIMFLVGILFTIVICLNIHRYILQALPMDLRRAITIGVGLFITFIGLQNSGIIVADKETLVQLGDVSATTIVAFSGILLSAVFMSKRIKGGLFLSIIICTLIGIPLGVTELPDKFRLLSMPRSISETFCAFDFSNIFETGTITVVLTLLFICIFDTMGTLLGLAVKSGMEDEKGNIRCLKGALLSDAIGTTFGAMVGTSSVTTFSESAAGVAEGGRTGVTGLTVGGLFLLALFISPVFLMIPMAATTGSLVMVGVLIIRDVAEIDFSDMTEALPTYITLIMIPLTYSIGEGVMLGLLSYVLVKIISGRFRETNLAMNILALLIALKFALNVDL